MRGYDLETYRRRNAPIWLELLPHPFAAINTNPTHLLALVNQHEHHHRTNTGRTLQNR